MARRVTKATKATTATTATTATKATKKTTTSRSAQRPGTSIEMPGAAARSVADGTGTWRHDGSLSEAAAVEAVRDRVRRRAFALYEQRVRDGRGPDPVADWLQAEREVHLGFGRPGRDGWQLVDQAWLERPRLEGRVAPEIEVSVARSGHPAGGRS